jgi:ABC-type transporter Mla subunit MlaD
MPAVNIDRQAIERRDFPIGRRGYDPAAVDAHLRSLANEIEELQRAHARDRAESPLAAAAGTQVQSILAAAETAAADIERQARDSARATREDADRDARRTREDAIAQARTHVAAVAQAASVLLERVSAMDTEARALVESLRAGGGRLAGDLAAVDTNMGELYDAASGRPADTSAADIASAHTAPGPSGATGTGAAPAEPSRAPATGGAPTSAAPASAAPPTPSPAPSPPVRTPASDSAAGPAPAAAAPGAEGADLDGARLIALNMALNGESRADTDRYLAENFQLADRGKLIDEVYAAIEG